METIRKTRPMQWTVVGLFASGVLVVALMAQDTTSLVVNGQHGTAKVVQVQGHNYVDVDGLVRLTNGSISFKGEQIVLTLPGGPTGGGASAAAAQPKGFSKEFLTAAVESGARIREWHSALRTAIERGVPLTTGWLDAYQRQAMEGLNLASVAISTDSDRNAFPVITQAFNKVKNLEDKYMALAKSLTYFAPNSLQSDPLEQSIVTCGQSLSAMAAARQFVEDAACQ